MGSFAYFRASDLSAAEADLKHKIYIVLHCEIFNDGRGGHVTDDMVFYVVSSMEKALRSIRKSHVAAYSWWEVQEAVLDDSKYEWPKHIGYFGRKGGRLKERPDAKCIALFEKYKAEGHAMSRPLRVDHSE